MKKESHGVMKEYIKLFFFSCFNSFILFSFSMASK